MFEEHVASTIAHWPEMRHWGEKKHGVGTTGDQTVESQIQMQKMAKESPQNDPISEQAIVVIEETTTSITEHTSVAQLPFTSS